MIQYLKALVLIVLASIVIFAFITFGLVVVVLLTIAFPFIAFFVNKKLAKNKQFREKPTSKNNQGKVIEAEYTVITEEEQKDQ